MKTKHKTKKQRKAIKQIKIKNKKLIKQYPFLIPYNVWTGKKDPDYDYTYTMLMDGGWFKLQTQLCKELRPLLVRANYLYKYELVQVKEKCGQLRWYSNGTPKSISDEYRYLIFKYENLSEQTCIKCGRPAKMTCNGGWFEPYCKKCMERIHNNYNKHRKESIPFTYEDYICED